MTSTNAPAFQQSGDFFRLTRAEVESSPSVRDRTFSSWNDELMKRETMCNFIAAMGKQLKLQFPVLVANVFLHCFFSRRSFREYADADVVSAACLFLAAKVEEHRRKVSQVIEAMRIVRDPNAVALHPESPEFVRMRDAIFDCERDLLDTIEYRLNVELPFSFLSEVIHTKTCSVLRNRDVASNREIASNAWMLVSECFKTPARLMYPAQTIAMCCLALSASLLDKHEKTDRSFLQADFNISADAYDHICALTLGAWERSVSAAVQSTSTNTTTAAAAVAASSLPASNSVDASSPTPLKRPASESSSADMATAAKAARHDPFEVGNDGSVERVESSGKEEAKVEGDSSALNDSWESMSLPPNSASGMQRGSPSSLPLSTPFLRSDKSHGGDDELGYPPS